MNNRFKYIYAYILCALLCVTAGSCFKDKGNYDYTAINAVTIDSFGNKAALYLDSLIIKPAISAGPDESVLKDTGRWSYLWTAAIVNRVAAKGDVPLITLSKSKDLRIKLTMRPEKYTLYFKITDNYTGNIFYMQTALTVTTSTHEGWLLLTDINNVARLDMVSFMPAPLTDTFVLTDLLKNYGVPEMHGPRNIAFTLANQGNYVYVTAADGGHKLDADVFFWQSSYNLKYECLFEYGVNFSPGYVMNSGSGGGGYLLNYGSDFYYQNQITAAGYGIPVNRVAGETADFDASPLIGKANNSGNPGILFDRTKKRFLRLNDGAATCVELPEPTTSPIFSYKPNMDLLYITTNQANSITYAILKDPATNKVWVYSFTLTTSSLAQNFARELTGTDIANAEQFAVSPEYGYLFYNVGSKVYEVDYDNPTVSKLAVDLGSKKISLLKFHQFRAYSGAKYLPVGKCLMIGSYDPGLPVGSCGTLSQYTVPGLAGTPVLVRSYSGMGKIVSLTYRER
jgi:hypothetical protein